MGRAGAFRLPSIAVAVALSAAAPALAEPAPQPAANPVPAPELRNTPPMVFFIAKGEADACGLACGEWIAAVGAIDSGTPQRLRALLNTIARTHRRKPPPIYFFSPGGSVTAAMEIGRIMRGLKMKAGVARTIPQGCDPKQIREKACDAIMRSGRELAAELRTERSMCASACVYALLGATEREVAPGAGLGVHSISITRTMIRKNHEGRVLATKSTRITGDTPDIREAHGRVARYAADMGIARGLVDAAAAVPSQKIRFITRDEIVRFGIDTREVAETRWVREEDKSGRAGLVKFVISARGERKQYRTSLLRLSCVSKRVLVQYAWERDAFEKVRSVAVLAGDSEIALRPIGKPVLKENGLETEVRAAFAVPAYFEDAVRRERIEVVEVPDGAPPGAAPRRMTLSTAGLPSSLGMLSENCN
jgi:hypothetical protein